VCSEIRISGKLIPVPGLPVPGQTDTFDHGTLIEMLDEALGAVTAAPE
jgi:hypothetical protein